MSATERKHALWGVLKDVEGRAEGRLSILTKLVKLNKLSIKEAADEADMTEADFMKLTLQ